MKHLVLVPALLIGGVLSAHADTDFWSNSTKHPRSYWALQSAARYCTVTVGPNLNGRRTPRIYKSCMAGIGWRYVRTRVEYPYYASYPYYGRYSYYGRWNHNRWYYG